MIEDEVAIDRAEASLFQWQVIGRPGVPQVFAELSGRPAWTVRVLD